MAMQEDSLIQLANCLLQTLSPNVEIRRPAEKFIESCEKQPGFCRLLLQLLDRNDGDPSIKLCAAIFFKNIVRKHWAHQDDSEEDRINISDRDFVKSVIVDLMLRSEENIQRQLSEAVSIIGREDFPAKWPNLLENMLVRVNESCAQCNFVVINGILRTANSLFRRYHIEAKSQELWTEIKFVMDTFAKPFTELFCWIVKLIPQHMNNEANIKVIFNSLVFCAKIYYSLNYQDLPEFFEDNLSVWMTNFIELLRMNIQSLQNDSDEEPSVVENLKSQICENIGMYAEKYSEEFEPYLSGFIQQVWDLLGCLSNQIKYDILASHAIRFLSIVAERGLSQEIFKKEQVLQHISSRIIIPSMEFREVDEELFEDNPEEYIRRDIEGADVHTRRRAACDFVKSLAKHFEGPMTEVFSKYIESMLFNFSQDEQKNWRSKNAAIYLVTSLAVKGGSVRLGTTSTSDLINISDFFNNIIRSDLEQADLNAMPVLKADALKYIITFRNQLSVNEILIPTVPQLIRHMSSPNVVIHSYAANCVEKMLTLRDPVNKSVPLIKSTDITQYALPLMEGLFSIFQYPGSQENEFAIKAIMRLFSLLRELLMPYYGILLPKMVEKLTEVTKNPSKPNFNHYLFETIALSVKVACSKDPSAVSNFESVLFPIFQNILVQDVQEFMPYVFQIISIFLETYPASQTLPTPYQELFPFLLTPALWEKPAFAEPLVRLLQAYIRDDCQWIVNSAKLQPVLGVFQKLIASKSNDHEGFNLLCHLLLYADQAALMAMMKQVFIILFQRLTSSKTIKFTRSLLVFFSLYVYKYDAKSLYEMIESIQRNMFAMVVEKIFIADAQKVCGAIERKTVSVGIIKLLTELDAFFVVENLVALWAPLLQVVVAIFELPEDKTAEENEHYFEIENTLGYQASYTKLTFARKKPFDPIETISEPRAYLAQALSNLSSKHPGKLNPLIRTMSPDAINYLEKYCLFINVSLT